MSLPRGYNEAGAEWLEPWCDEHPDLDGEGCVACIGASHDAWMHRAKAAEAEVERLRALVQIHREERDAEFAARRRALAEVARLREWIDTVGRICPSHATIDRFLNAR